MSTKKSPAMFSFGLGRAELDKKEKGSGRDTPGPDFIQPEGIGKQVPPGVDDQAPCNRAWTRGL